jgi:hypothetical protein
MAIRLLPDEHAPTVAIELTLMRPLPDYDIEEVERPTPRDVDEILVSQGFRDLVDDARAALGPLLDGTGLEIAQLTGAIARGEEVHRPGLWLVLRETGAPADRPMSSAARERAAAVANDLRHRLHLS